MLSRWLHDFKDLVLLNTDWISFRKDSIDFVKEPITITIIIITITD